MDHLLEDEELPRRERELTLSTGAILGIFLGLAVLCGGFFGFGYNMGRKSAPTPLNLSDVSTDPVTSGAASAKPTPGVPAGEDASAPVPVVATRPIRRPAPAVETRPDSAEGETSAVAGAVLKPVPSRTAPGTLAPTTAPIVRQPAPVSPSALSPSVAPPAASAAGGTFIVQVAAVSHKEDADLLIGALRSRGYAVSARSGASDNFIHVQVGPFHDKKEADAMRQRLLTDGYNAIVKQ